MTLKSFIISSALLCLGFSAMAQSSDPGNDADFGIWQYISVSHSFTDKIGGLVRLEHRSKNNAQDLDCGLFMPGVWYKPASWLQLCVIYDYAMASGGARRHVLLPYAQVSKKTGNWTLSFREMGQYVMTNNTLLMRTKFQAQYKIPDTRTALFCFIEPYSNPNLSEKTDQFNPLVNAANYLGVARSTNMFGLQFSLGKKSTLEPAYCYYYLGAGKTPRHLFSLGYSIRL